MSQMEEFLKQVEAVQGKEEKVLIVTGKPGSGKSKLLREAAEDKGWDYVDTRLLITEEFLKLLPSERKEQAPAMLTEELAGHRGDVILLDRVQTLFVPVFHIDPKSVIDALGKAYTVVLAWPGYVNDGLLCYDKFDGTESIRISAADYTVWEVE
ncbi:MAG: BREX-3 system P-loop-containing protein BrxF [Acidaminococcus fermentans]|uniref:BREX-3 system P-loop-containing protein BrxF n=1 Tax=Acidaminococcus fermentans TaxID=905 RepID=UPI0024303B41|nr:BREX-3 system P-loop-containing protein BrxF [Acidaminococcus fermentans]MCF0139095.1 BREX-3 system P-loop-containing protein BrxF [Acidaminococcus fermentans]